MVINNDIQHFEQSYHWYLAASKPCQELRAIENLKNQGIDAFSPTIFVEKIYSGKKKVVEEALFTGYIFIYLSPEDGAWHKVRSTRGVRDWIRFSGMPAKLSSGLVNSFIQVQLENDKEKVVKKCFNRGDFVRILSGPFKGLKGIYEIDSGEERAIILLDFLGKTNRLKVTNEQLVATE